MTNPVADTEYTHSFLRTTSLDIENLTLKNGTIYNGPSNSINGVTSYVKNVLLYDVTSLYEMLRTRGIVVNDSQLQTWCDENLE